MTAVSLNTDLMGLGLAPALANLMGDQVSTVAGVGTAQAGAAALGTSITLLTTAASQTAFVLPAAAQLLNGYLVSNTSATTALIFPPTGGAIDQGSANASVSVAQNKTRILIRTSANVWISLSGA
jgi:hypothetical protein